MLKLSLKPVVMAFALATLGPVFNSAVPAAEDGAKQPGAPPATAPTPASTTTQAAPVGTVVTSDEEAAIANAGVKALRELSQIRADVHNGNGQAAISDMDKVESLLGTIQASVPTSAVRDRIWIARKHLEYESASDVLPDLTPVYAGLNELAHFMPVDQARQHIDRAKEHLAAGDRNGAGNELEAADDTLKVTEVDLPLAVTRKLLTDARRSLDAGDTGQADQALKSAEASVVYLSVAIQQPLFRAKAMLWRAVVDYEADDIKLAQSDLQAAIADLETAGHSDQKATREAVVATLPQAKQFLSDLQNSNDIGAQLHRLLGRTEAMTHRSVQYLATSWARYRAPNAFASDLIEARLHVENGRIDRFTGHDLGQAKQELQTAAQYLKQAVNQTGEANVRDADQARIAELEKTATELAGNTALSPAAKYDEIETGLDAMIGTL